MNNKERLITGIKNARNAHERWLNQSCLLLDREYIHTVQEPISCIECEFTLLLSSERHSLKNFPWFAEIESLHQAFHDANSSIFDQAQTDFNSEKLRDCFASLESHSNLLTNNLDNILESLETAKEGVFEANEGELKNEDFECVNKGVSKQSSLHKRLKRQDLKQLALEQQLTEQELFQLEERQELVRLGIEQILQYQQLKKEEITQQSVQYLELEDENLNAQESAEQEIIRIKQQILLAQDELEPLLWVDQKYDEVDKLVQENKINESFEKSQFTINQELAQLEQQRQTWQYEIESLKQQMKLITEDIEALEQQQKMKQLKLDESNQEKEKQLSELQQNVQEHDKLNSDKYEAKERKEIELKQLEKDLTAKKQELEELKRDSGNLKEQKVEVNETLEYQLKQLETDYYSKQHQVESLEQDRLYKQQELAGVSSRQKITESSLRQLEHIEQQQISQNSLSKLDQKYIEQEVDLEKA